MTSHSILWTPSDQRRSGAAINRFMDRCRIPASEPETRVRRLYDWSVHKPEEFWQAVWDFCEVIGERGNGPVLTPPADVAKQGLAAPSCAPGYRWFASARLNFAENLLRFASSPQHSDHLALIFHGEGQTHALLS